MSRKLKERNHSPEKKDELNLLREKIKAIGTQKEVAKKIGISEVHIGRLVNGDWPMKKSYTYAIDSLYKKAKRRK